MKSCYARKHASGEFTRCVRSIDMGILFFALLCCSLLVGKVHAVRSSKTEAISTTSKALTSHYNFRPVSMCFFLHENGFLSAHNLRNGDPMWTIDTQSPAVDTELEKMPSSQCILNDPFALPFIVKGNRLFTRIRNNYKHSFPFSSFVRDKGKNLSSNERYSFTEKVSKEARELQNFSDPDAIDEYFFMDLTTLMRRSPIMINGTDIYVSTSVTIADIDVTTGEYVMVSSSNPHNDNGRPPPRAHESSLNLGQSHNSKDDSMLYEKQPNEGEIFEQMEYFPVKVSQPHNPLLPMLHMVRYNIYIHAYKLGAYKWTMTLTQTRFSERSLSHSQTKSSEDQVPRFFSHMLRDILQVEENSHLNCGDKIRSAKAKTFGSTRSPNALEYTEALSNGRNVSDNVEFTLSSVDMAGKVVKKFIFKEVNSTHVALWNVQDKSELWQAKTFKNVDLDINNKPVIQRKDLFSDDFARRAPSGYLMGFQIASAYVWITPQQEILRVPILKNCDLKSQMPNSTTSPGLLAMPSNHFDESSLDQMVCALSQDIWGKERIPGLCAAWEDDLGTEMIDNDDLENYYNDKLSWYDEFLFLLRNRNNASERARKGSNGIAIWLTWRMLVTLSFHIICFACSLAFLCAGVPPRGRLQRAWAQADRNRLALSISQPWSSKFKTQDLVTSSSLMDTPLSKNFSASHVLPDPLSNATPTNILTLPDYDIFTNNSFSKENFLLDSPSMASGHNNQGETPNKLYQKRLDHRSKQGPIPSKQRSVGIICESKVSRHSENPEGCEGGNTRSSSSNSDDGLAELHVYLQNARMHNSLLKKGFNHTVSASDELKTMDRPSLSNKDENLPAMEASLFKEHFNILKKIGHGAEGSVFCVEHRWTHSLYAIKAIQVDTQGQERVVREAVLHSSFDHHNVVRFFFCWIEDVPFSVANDLQLLDHDDGMDTISVTNSDDPNAQDPTTDPDILPSVLMLSRSYRMLFIQMEYFPRGTLADLLRCRTGFRRLENLQYIKNIAEGLSYLHDIQNVVHRDLKPTNIFLSTNDVLKIGDFGLATRRDPPSHTLVGRLPNPRRITTSINHELSAAVGSPLYCSPEQMHNECVNKPSDVFSLGIIAVEMYCVFHTQHERIQVLTRAREQILPDELITNYPREAKLIADMLKGNPLHRPLIRKVVKILTKIIYEVEDESGKYSEVFISADESPSHLDLIHCQSAVAEA